MEQRLSAYEPALTQKVSALPSSGFHTRKNHPEGIGE